MIGKWKQTVLVLVALLGLSAIALPVATVSAAEGDITCPSGERQLTDGSRVCCPSGSQDDPTECLFAKYVGPVVAGLSVLAGIAVVVGIIMGGIQYASSGGDPQKAAKGKSSITKALVGLVSYLFLFGALQFLSPGGLSTNSTPSGNGGTIAEQCSRQFMGINPWYIYLEDSAFEPGTCNIENFTLLGEGNDLGRVILAIADGLVKVAAIIAVAFVIVGGFQFLTSQGDPERAKHARTTVLNALIGLVIAIIAVAVVSFIGNQLTS